MKAPGAGGKTSGGCRNSFEPGTQVLLDEGRHEAIEDVQIGDQVQAADPQTGEEGPRTVTALIEDEGIKRLVDINIDTDGAAGEATGTLTATDEHPFWVENTRKWTTAADLKAALRSWT